jgi:CO/xanthine dehydrogenase Mo-binding subunit
VTQDLQFVGQTYPVHDAAEKATGDLVFGTDMQVPGMLYAKLLLSPVAHAVVKKLDAGKAEGLPGVVGVFSHENAPETPYCRPRFVPDEPLSISDETLFAATARFVGDRVAAVVATSEEVAAEAVRLIDVEYEELPPVLTAEAALAAGAIPIHAGGNLVSEYDCDFGTAAAQAPDAVSISTTVRTQKVHHAALEPHMCLADYDRSGQLTIWSPCQGVYGARSAVADLLGLSYSRVRVIKVPLGGSFGGKQEFIFEPLTAFLAMRTGRPVKLVLSREECIIATTTRPATTSTIRTVFNSDGSLLDMEVDTLLDAGAYAGSSPEYALLMAHKLTRLYRTPHYRHRGRVAYTTTPVAGGCRGWGAPEVATCAEIHLDRVAEMLGLDPVDLRLRNLVYPGDIDLAGEMPLGDARVRECLQLGADAFEWRARVAQPSGAGRVRRGVGVACGAHYNGLRDAEHIESSTMTLKVNEDGSVDLNASLHEVGCGTVTAMKLILAEELGIDCSRISAGEADTETTPYDIGCYASRMIYVCGAAARATAIRLKERLVEAAADLLDLTPGDLRAAPGGVEVADDPGRSLSSAEIVQRTRMRSGQDVIVTNTYEGLTNPGSYSVQFAEVEVDVLTGLVRVTDFLAVADVGQAINRGMIEGQYRGAIQMGIGYALCEDVALDERGRPAPGGFKNYHLVNAPDMPAVRVLMVEHEGDDGPYGAKSVGEIATVPPAAAVINALNHAHGTTIATLPATPERVLAALAEPGTAGGLPGRSLGGGPKRT